MRKTCGILLALLLVVPAAADDPPVVRDPAADLGLFPDSEEVAGTLREAARHPWVELHRMGTSQEGRPILLLEVERPQEAGDAQDEAPGAAEAGTADPPEDAQATPRAITFIMTQQHGNEPAGTPAALRILDRLLEGDLAHLLEDQVVLLLAMANPDGAEGGHRYDTQGRDINRDHVHLETAEAQIIHDVLNQWDVHVALDHHEYSGTGLGNPVPVRFYDHDLTTLFARHGNVPQASLEAAQDLMYEGIWPAARQQGYTVNEYGERTVAGIPVDQVAGGPDPGILRNSFGLHNVAGLLVETRVDAHPNPFHDAERRTHIHEVVIEATLEHVQAHAQRFIEAKQEGRGAPFPAEYLEGDRQGRLHEVYVTQEDLDTLLVRHALPAPVAVDGQHVHDLRHERPGLHAALLHPESSRAVADAAPADGAQRQALEPEATVDATARAPALGAAWLALGLAGLLVLGFRRR